MRAIAAKYRTGNAILDKLISTIWAFNTAPFVITPVITRLATTATGNITKNASFHIVTSISLISVLNFITRIFIT